MRRIYKIFSAAALLLAGSGVLGMLVNFYLNTPSFLPMNEAIGVFEENANVDSLYGSNKIYSFRNDSCVIKKKNYCLYRFSVFSREDSLKDSVIIFKNTINDSVSVRILKNKNRKQVQTQQIQVAF